MSRRDHIKINHSWLKTLAVLFHLVLAPFMSEAFALSDAEIISVVGKGDKRDPNQAEWVAAAPKQTVKAGGFVRTLDMSQIALLLPDRTQLRLNQNSQMQIKTLAEASEWNQTTVKLNSGRAWSQARPASASPGSGSAPTKISMETPSATLSIRGTDWEVEILPDGRTQLVVLSGLVDIANEHGSLSIGSGQAATAEIGKAPIRLSLANPVGRVQWVTAWQAQPKRWVTNAAEGWNEIFQLIDSGNPGAAHAILLKLPNSLERDLLQADLLATVGEIEQATSLLAPHARNGFGNPFSSALLSRLYLAKGDQASAKELLNVADAAHADNLEVVLAKAEIARFSGDLPAARLNLDRAIRISPTNPEALFISGSIDTERENIRAARGALESATKFRQGFSRAIAERATIETLAGQFDAASEYFQQSLAITPDDYLALTGRGILKLKTGDSEEALKDFLRAGVIEPRFARAWLYSAAAFYQLGDIQRAEQALRKASELDPNDPLPYVLGGLIQTDMLSLDNSLEMARSAQERMHYLKSLNQIQNNQKGSANIGSSLAALGMEEWARYYAMTAYSPWWAGSHLFLSDRYAPGFNKNSELFKGFITDSAVFGASQRYSSLLPSPGHHGRLDLFVENADWQQNALIGTANGFSATPVQTAYFISGDLSSGHSRLDDDSAHGKNITIGLGMRPHHAVGIFLFGTDTSIKGRLENATLPDDPLSINETRLDLGLNLKLDSQNQFWMKSGSGQQTALITGLVATPAIVPLDRFETRVKQSDTQLRHAVALFEKAWFSWGYESSRQEKPAHFDVQLQPGTTTLILERNNLHTRDTYATFQMPLSRSIRTELGAFWQLTDSMKYSNVKIDSTSPGNPVYQARDDQKMNWRGGLQVALADHFLLTAVSQKWRRPASTGSLSPIDTLGIPVNDRLTTNGGLYRRNRLQVDHEMDRDTFLSGFADHEQINNLTSPLTAVVPDLQLTQLESLRNRRDAFTMQPELEEAPQFLSGRVKSYGFSINHRISSSQTFAIRYRHSDAEQTGLRSNLKIPYVPENYLRLASYWSLPNRLLVGTTATWRGERFKDEANSFNNLIDAGWGLGASLYWESANKRWVAQAILDNVRFNRSSSGDQNTKLILRASYLF
jgi:tetratricopeptide (TPR) repeat protein